jgi:sugar O-acyltransferase (sialic acid O-acetyltransferase NeuD family)
MKKLIIFGNTIMAKLILFYFNRDSKYEIAGFTVDKRFNNQGTQYGHDIFNFESLEETHPPSDHDLFVAIGPSKMNTLRESKFHEAKEKGYELASYISPHAVCASPVGENSFVGDMAVIAPFSNIGNNNYFYDSVVISNDASIGNNCYFSPQSYVGTFCRVMDNSILGTGSTLKSSVTVAKKTLVGASAYISRDTKENGVYGERNAEFFGCVSGKIEMS